MQSSPWRFIGFKIGKKLMKHFIFNIVWLNINGQCVHNFWSCLLISHICWECKLRCCTIWCHVHRHCCHLQCLSCWYVLYSHKLSIQKVCIVTFNDKFSHYQCQTMVMSPLFPRDSITPVNYSQWDRSYLIKGFGLNRLDFFLFSVKFNMYFMVM